MNRFRRIIVAAACVVLVLAGNSRPGGLFPQNQAAPSPQPAGRALADGLAMTPPMGWYPWNAFGEEPQNEKLIREIAEALVSSGL